jgi:hypothetical protein
LRTFLFATVALILVAPSAAEIPAELRVGRAGHAFDHLGGIGSQAQAAAESGATILYTGGLGEAGYGGIPPQAEFGKLLTSARDYSATAKERGIELTIGYLCATSIVKLDSFDKNWTTEFRRQFRSPPAEWRQQDRQGKPLASWYGGDYSPACMSNPDWRAYERAMVRYQLETGHDGIFFDNPTVHPQGCYCRYCMQEFAKTSKSGAGDAAVDKRGDAGELEASRAYAEAHPKEFLQFRSTIARDFLTDMRVYARSINPHALATCNNSLNSPGALFSQCRTYGYNIFEMSKAEDYVVVEDMATQPRVEANGQSFEYGPTYKQLKAISHGKPVVAVTVANGDYHTPPNLMRLAMAEAAASGASYLSWPTWPEAERKRMIAAVRPEADFLRRNEALLNDIAPRADIFLFLPFRRWTETENCAASGLAAALTKINAQFRVISDADLESLSDQAAGRVLVVESRSVFTPEEKRMVEEFEETGGHVVAADQPHWLEQLNPAIGRSAIAVSGSPYIRAVVGDQSKRTIIHLYNLNIQRLSSFEDKVTPANDVKVVVRVPFATVREVTVQTPDANATAGKVSFSADTEGESTIVTFTVPRLEINSLIEISR